MSATVRLSAEISAEPRIACEVIRDWQSWPQAFPATIQAVSLVGSTARSLTLQVWHKQEGPVINILQPDDGQGVRLKEYKGRYDAQFTFFATPSAGGSRLHVHGCFWLKGWASWAGCLAAPIIRRRMRQYLLEPIRTRAEALSLASRARGRPAKMARL